MDPNDLSIHMVTIDRIHITVNGLRFEIETDRSRSLLDILRENLKLTGAKRGCEGGYCGACTVIVDGSPMLACRIKAVDADGTDVLTIEGLSDSRKLHPLQAHFLHHGAVQCGFCTPGMILHAYAILLKGVTDKRTIERELRGHLCRCTGYLPIVHAIQSAARELSGARNARHEPFVCQSPWRIDGIDKVTGKALYADDYRIDGCLHAVPYLSPSSSGILKNLEIEFAQAESGVIKIMTAKDIPGQNRIGRWRRDRPVFVEDRIRFEGDVLALIVAETAVAARRALDRITCQIEPLEGVYDLDSALLKDINPLHPEGNVAASISIRKNWTESSPDNSGFSSVMMSGFIDHSLLEPVSASAYPDPDGTLVVVGPSQNVFFDRLEISRILGIPFREQRSIRVIAAQMGGAFGKHEDLSVQHLAALAAWHLKKPVKITLTQAETRRMTTKRHPFKIRHQSWLSVSGQIARQRVSALADTGAYSSWAPNILRKACVHANGPYAIPSLLIEGKSVFTNNAFSGAMRGFGAVQTILAAETHIDFLASQSGIDPAEFRKKCLLSKGKKTATGQNIEYGDASAVLDLALNSFGWNDASKHRCKSRNQAIGFGVACSFYGIGYGNQIPDKGQAEIRIHPSGKATIRTSAVDYGQGAATVFAQIMSDTLGIPMERIELLTGDTHETPDSGSTVASRQTMVTGNAVFTASKILKSRLLNLASAQFNCPPDQIIIRIGRWQSPDKRLSWDRLIRIAANSNLDLASAARYLNKSGRLTEDDGQGDVYSIYVFSAVCAEVDVNLKNGGVKARRLVSAHDSGRIINPVLARSQVYGGVLMGAGMALCEEYRTDKGRALFPVSKEKQLRFGDVPHIETHFMESDCRSDDLKAYGLGEPAMLAAAPAIVNAVSNATGKFFNRVPLTPEIVKEVLRRS